MCSDGLWGLVKQENIKEILAQAASPQAACEQLIQMANENGGRDNITALIVSRGVEEKRNDE
jgi:protein phosphatase